MSDHFSDFNSAALTPANAPIRMAGRIRSSAFSTRETNSAGVKTSTSPSVTFICFTDSAGFFSMYPHSIASLNMTTRMRRKLFVVVGASLSPCSQSPICSRVIDATALVPKSSPNRFRRCRRSARYLSESPARFRSPITRAINSETVHDFCARSICSTP